MLNQNYMSRRNYHNMKALKWLDDSQVYQWSLRNNIEKSDQYFDDLVLFLFAETTNISILIYVGSFGSYCN